MHFGQCDGIPKIFGFLDFPPLGMGRGQIFPYRARICISSSNGMLVYRWFWKFDLLAPLPLMVRCAGNQYFLFRLVS